jgi:uncharacterized phage-associated protein
MAVSAHDVAREIRHRLPGVGVVVVHKLLYYCQGWHLAWTGKALFREGIEAWSNGPVVADLWHDENKSRPVPTPEELDDGAQSTISWVVTRYGHLSGIELVRLTHSEPPWKDASENSWIGVTGISSEALRKFFSADPEQIELRKMMEELAAKGEYKRAVDATSRPRKTPVVDETDALRALLQTL